MKSNYLPILLCLFCITSKDIVLIGGESTEILTDKGKHKDVSQNVEEIQTEEQQTETETVKNIDTESEHFVCMEEITEDNERKDHTVSDDRNVTQVNDITIVKTSEGPVRGHFMMSLRGRLFIAFRGIPYAEPPVGYLRFKPPIPSRPWTDIRNARDEGSVCPQFLFGSEQYVGNEDCLFLNIYTHYLARNVPVIVWVHSGAFYAGDGGIKQNGPEFIMDQYVIFVTLNYRLGTLGFMSTGDEHLPGNYGLKDQVLALKWLKKNIVQFGGDPQRIVLYGETAGGACVQLHQYSPLSAGLMSGVIFLSGSMLCPWAFRYHPIDVTKKVATLVNCTTETTESMVQCLSKIPAEDLVKTLYHFPHWMENIPAPFAPVKEIQSEDSDDPPFLTEYPEDLLKRGQTNPVPVITGNAEDECATMLHIIEQDNTTLHKLDLEYKTIIRRLLRNNCLPDEDIEKIRTFYLGDSSFSDAPISQLIAMFSDAVYIYGIQRSARQQSSTTYVYYYVFKIGTDASEEENAYTDVEPSKRPEILLKRHKGQEKEENLAENIITTLYRMGKMFADFAATGHPTPEISNFINTRWLPTGKSGNDRFRYMVIGQELKMQDMPQAFYERMQFWDRIYRENELTVFGKCNIVIV